MTGPLHGPGRNAMTLLLFVLVLAPWHVAGAVVLEGTGQAVIRGENIDDARERARKAALREVALQYEAEVSSSDTMENGVLTESRLTVASRARARNVQILDERRHGDILRLRLRADMSAGQSCGAGEAAGLRKRVAITGFPVLHPGQARIGRIDDAGETLPQALQKGLQQDGGLQVLAATSLRLFDDLSNAPTQQHFDNHLSNVVQVARELGAQFVVTGVIRDLAVEDPSAWGESIIDRMSRGLGTANQNRRFAVDLLVYDGFSGSPIYRELFAASGEWDASRGSSAGFGSAGFQQTAYGQAVSAEIARMQTAVKEALACQPFITRITRVQGQQVTLASGATAGLRPGDELHLYRSLSHFDAPGATPELRDAGTRVTLDSVHPEFSNGLMPRHGGLENIQRGDIAIVW